MNIDIMHHNLLDFKEVMDKHNVKFVLIFGALLGVVRGGDLIEWDNDVDVACFRPDKPKIDAVNEDMRKLGFQIIQYPEVPDHDNNFKRNGEKIEIWWFDDMGDEWYYDAHIRYKKNYFDNTEKINFLGKEWDVPSNKESFLDLTYGSDWRIPDRNKTYIL